VLNVLLLQWMMLRTKWLKATFTKGVCNLDLIFDSAGKVVNHEGGLHHSGGHKERVVQVMPLELVQQGIICGLREAENIQRQSNDMMSHDQNLLNRI